ncbi:hypothetical protein P280DRAFT_528985 [Massarina eburnea CBS 473.64]|uniref:Uncharacterized protein n=1 Tax=Massarina eburnea CBS 473.64 TaxID=1395130 RepID=A0A6A6RVJ5_9PLEO|nr:hypothetical protein P280DRAFT_528985 [Massarina eburnea CBS 473.64]
MPSNQILISNLPVLGPPRTTLALSIQKAFAKYDFHEISFLPQKKGSAVVTLGGEQEVMDAAKDLCTLKLHGIPVTVTEYHVIETEGDEMGRNVVDANDNGDDKNAVLDTAHKTSTYWNTSPQSPGPHHAPSKRKDAPKSMTSDPRLPSPTAKKSKMSVDSDPLSVPEITVPGEAEVVSGIHGLEIGDEEMSAGGNAVSTGAAANEPLTRPKKTVTFNSQPTYEPQPPTSSAAPVQQGLTAGPKPWPIFTIPIDEVFRKPNSRIPRPSPTDPPIRTTIPPLSPTSHATTPSVNQSFPGSPTGDFYTRLVMRPRKLDSHERAMTQYHQQEKARREQRELQELREQNAEKWRAVRDTLPDLEAYAPRQAREPLREDPWMDETTREIRRVHSGMRSLGLVIWGERISVMRNMGSEFGQVDYYFMGWSDTRDRSCMEIRRDICIAHLQVTVHSTKAKGKGKKKTGKQENRGKGQAYQKPGLPHTPQEIHLAQLKQPAQIRTQTPPANASLRPLLHPAIRASTNQANLHALINKPEQQVRIPSDEVLEHAQTAEMADNLHNEDSLTLEEVRGDIQGEDVGVDVAEDVGGVVDIHGRTPVEQFRELGGELPTHLLRVEHWVGVGGDEGRNGYRSRDFPRRGVLIGRLDGEQVVRREEMLVRHVAELARHADREGGAELDTPVYEGLADVVVPDAVVRWDCAWGLRCGRIVLILDVREARRPHQGADSVKLSVACIHRGCDGWEYLASRL